MSAAAADVTVRDMSGGAGTGPWRLFIGGHGVADWPSGQIAAEDPRAYAEEVARCVRIAIDGLSERAEKAERELENVLRELGVAHDAFVAGERAATILLRRSHDRRVQNERHRQLREAGSCQTCGAEARPGSTRCLPCSQVNAAITKKRAARKAAFR